MIGRKIIYRDTLESTNNYVANLQSESKIEHGTAILAGNQTAGRGQRAAKWDSEPYKNLAFSCFLRHDNLTADRHFCLNQVISLACADFLNACHPGFSIKWPNDLVYESTKIGGILLENQLEGERIRSSIVGIGINVNQELFGDYNATSLKLLTGKEYDIRELVFGLTEKLNFWYDRLRLGQSQQISEAYLEKLWLLDVPSFFSDGSREFPATIRGTNEQGQLLVEEQGEVRKYGNKEIAFLARRGDQA